MYIKKEIYIYIYIYYTHKRIHIYIYVYIIIYIYIYRERERCIKEVKSHNLRYLGTMLGEDFGAGALAKPSEVEEAEEEATD